MSETDIPRLQNDLKIKATILFRNKSDLAKNFIIANQISHLNLKT